MTRLFWVGSLMLVLTVAFAGPAAAAAKEAKKGKAPAADTGGPPAGVTFNACGCYAKPAGGCVCTKKNSKCACPGECEPVGCAEKRDKELEKEASDAVKRAQEDDKKREQAENKRVQDEDKKRQAAESSGSGETESGDEAAASGDSEKPTAKSGKAARKGGSKK
jgi:hypothetical protein